MHPSGFREFCLYLFGLGKNLKQWLSLHENYLKLQAGYLFPEIARPVCSANFSEEDPEAGQAINIRLWNRRRNPKALAAKLQSRAMKAGGRRNSGNVKTFPWLWPRAGLRNSSEAKKSAQFWIIAMPRKSKLRMTKFFLSDGSKMRLRSHSSNILGGAK